MNLNIMITDENGSILDHIEVYQDGSDSEGSTKIRNWISENYKTTPDPDYDEFECAKCHKARDIENSIEINDELHCAGCIDEMNSP